ncbi:MAG TPA: hypothetical protein PKL12_08660, partial [Bacteroidales bacterium]|nr:hypothetical protein [Bacteroidales bacterium]HNZ70343.1 hypothetical protein [Prolixibacteraceae bacterium]HNW23117.1 hypothetical protein [Bacteroidales bacterium]HPH80802.1 hypothetical protein [Bacteroidales bacterium]HPM17196.1 hypothetical protein [Bacteroidales bacterium]
DFAVPLFPFSLYFWFLVTTVSVSRPRGESGFVFTLLRSGHTGQHQRNGNVPPRIPPLNAPATPWPARPPVCSAPHFPLAPLTGSTENPSRFRLLLHREESGWLCRVCHSTASRGAFHSKSRNTPSWQAREFVRSFQFLKCGVTSLTPSQAPRFGLHAAEVPHVARATSHAQCLGYMLHIRLFPITVRC